MIRSRKTRSRAPTGLGRTVAAVLAMALAACAGDSRLADSGNEADAGLRPDKLAIVGLLKLRNYAALERRLTALQKRFEAGKDPRGDLAAAFDAFEHSDPGAHKWLDEWVSRYPRSAAARLARGRYLAHLGWVARGTRIAASTTARQKERMAAYHAQSMRDLRDALKMNLRLPSAYCDAIAIHAGHGRVDAARAVFETAERAVPTARCHISKLAWFLTPKWHGDNGAALEAMLRDAERRSARDPRYAILKGFREYVAADGLFAKHKHEEAAALYDKAVRLNPRAYIIRKRGRNYMEMKRYDRALADFERALKLSPQDAKTLAMMAELHIRKREFEPALKHATQALALDPYVPYYLTVRLRARRLGGIPEKSAWDLRNALVFGADDPHVQGERAEYLENYYKKPAEARLAWKRAVELAPDSSHFRRGFWKNLALANDCEAVPAANAYLWMCLAGGDCGSGDIVHVSRITNRAIRMGRCKYEKHHVALAMRDRLSESQLARILSEKAAAEPPTTPDFVGETQLDAVTLEGLRPGMSIAEVARLYPDMKIDRTVHPRTNHLMRASGTVLRDSGQWRIQVIFSALGQVQDIRSHRTFRSARKAEAIRRDTIAKYGKPNRETSGSKLGLVYREGGGKRDFDAALIIEIEKLPEGAQAPPGEGEALRIVSILTDNRVRDRAMKSVQSSKGRKSP